MLKLLQQKIPPAYLLLFFLFFSLIFFWLNQTLFFKEPAVWPDEVFFADVASNFINEGWLNTHLIKGFSNELGNAKEVHPLYLWSLIFWFKLFGFSLLNQRLLSFVVGIGVLIIFYVLQKFFLKNNISWLSLLVFSLFAFDFTFNKALRVGRPEIFIIFFLLLACYFFLKFPSRTGMLGSGFFMGLASVTHPIGFLGPAAIFLYLVMTERLHLFSQEKNYYSLMAFCFPIFFWLLYIWPDFNTWQSQLRQAVLTKGIELPWIILVFQSQPLLIKLLYIFYLISGFTIFLFFKKEKQYLLLGCFFLITLIFVTLGKMFWYFGLVIPFIYLCLSSLLYESLKNQKYLILFFSLLVLCLLSNLSLQKTLLNSFSGNNYEYKKFGRQILQNIPDNKTVFISSIPDPYYIFKENRRNNRLYQFSSVYLPEEIYYKNLNDSEYIVYTGSLNEIVFGDFLEKYIKNNQKQIISIGSPNQYSGQIIELVPREQRIKVN